MRLRFVLAAILAALVLPGSADAGLIGLGGHAGYFKVSDDGEKEFYAGAHARLRLPAFIAVEGALDYRSSATRTLNHPVPGTEVDVTTYPITLSALAYPTPMIYILAGVGWYNTTIEFKNSEITTGPLSETILFGNVAARAGKRLFWDGPNLKVTNVPEAHEYLRRQYREGWTL